MRQLRAIEGDTADLICYREYGTTQGVTEQLLELNPGLADIGPVIPVGTLVNLPDAPVAKTSNTINLWD